MWPDRFSRFEVYCIQTNKREKEEKERIKGERKGEIKRGRESGKGERTRGEMGMGNRIGDSGKGRGKKWWNIINIFLYNMQRLKKNTI